MLNLKKTALAVLAFGSSAVIAGTMGPVCTPGNVTVPCAHSAWNFGGQALYLQSNYSGIDFIGSNTQILPAGIPNTQTFNQGKDNWGWGFKLEGSYHFNTGNDLNLNWYHFNETTKRTFIVPAGYTFNDNIQNSYTGVVNTSRKPTWDAVNLEFGQHVDFGERKDIRFHGGVQYARINTKMSFSSPLSTATTANSEAMTYNGFGFRVGMDMLYNWNNGLAMYANGATALLIGTSRFSDNASGIPTWSSVSGSTTAFVPELEGKLGATYTYAMTQGDLSLDVGWMWVNYFNSQQNADGNSGMQQSDFALQGPFIGLKWLGNFA